MGYSVPASTLGIFITLSLLLLLRVDITDDLRWKNRKNYAYRHHEDRMKIYDEEKFPYKIHNIPLKVN
jgi:hypothetical protein